MLLFILSGRGGTWKSLADYGGSHASSSTKQHGGFKVRVKAPKPTSTRVESSDEMEEILQDKSKEEDSGLMSSLPPDDGSEIIARQLEDGSSGDAKRESDGAAVWQTSSDDDAPGDISELSGDGSSEGTRDEKVKKKQKDGKGKRKEGRSGRKKKTKGNKEEREKPSCAKSKRKGQSGTTAEDETIKILEDELKQLKRSMDVEEDGDQEEEMSMDDDEKLLERAENRWGALSSLVSSDSLGEDDPRRFDARQELASKSLNKEMEIEAKKWLVKMATGYDGGCLTFKCTFCGDEFEGEMSVNVRVEEKTGEEGEGKEFGGRD
eukprot:765748-Hanusia_phi.AAC.2